MGSRSRKRKSAAKAVERVLADMAVSETPIHVAYTAMSRARADMVKPRTPAPKPSHVLSKESAGHQYIKGDRAMPPMLSPEERKLNRAARKPKLKRVRAARTVQDIAGHEVQVRVWESVGEEKRPVGRGGHYASETSGKSLVAGRVLEDKDLATVTVTQGPKKALTARQKRMRVLDGM